MPVLPPGPPSRPKSPGPKRRTALLLTMILAVLAAVLLIVFVLRLARKPGAKVNLGDQEFALGRDVEFAGKVKALGRPLLFAPLRGNITLYVQHLGTDPAHGWLAFDAQAPEGQGRCLVTWRPATGDFADCHGTVYPPDGTGLNQYLVRVDPSGLVIINLRQPVGMTPPTEPATTSTIAPRSSGTAVPTSSAAPPGGP